MANTTSKGRNREQRHVRIYHAMMETDAWRSLSGNAVKLLMHLAKMDNGSNNGSLFLSERDAAKAIGTSRNTAAKAFDDLAAHGFIAPAQRGHFKVKIRVATTWRLTWLPLPGRSGPSHNYKDWTAQNKSRAQLLTRTGPDIEPEKERNDVTGPDIEPVETANPQNSVKATGSKTGPHTVAIGYPLSTAAGSTPRPPLKGEVGVVPAGHRDPRRTFTAPDDPDRALPDAETVRARALAFIDQRGRGAQGKLARAAAVNEGKFSSFLHRGASVPARSLARIDQAILANPS